MRVIAGSARSLRLKTLDGMDTRPTTDRIKETLFNMIGPSMFDCVFLDLFAGSGGIGIEALSRGAREAVFVENNPKAMMCVKDNLKFTKLEGKAVTLTTDVMNALYKLEGEKVFDYIFLDPPYDRGFEKRVLEYLSDSSLVYEIPRSLWKRQKKLIFRIYRIWDLKLSEKKRIKRISTCLSRRRGKRKYVKSNLSGQF